MNNALATSIPELSIVIPCYNEEKNIPLIFDRLKNIIGEQKNIEVILVNNGSTDGTCDRIQTEINKAPDYFKIANIPINQGYGYGILKGLEATSGNFLAWTHADMQTDPNDVLDALKKFKSYENTNILVKGRRKNRGLMDTFFTWGMQMATLFIIKKQLSDINAQPKLFSRDFYNKFLKSNAPKDFSLDLYTLYQAKSHQMSILEVPVFFHKRKFGEAKGGGGSWKNRIRLISRTFKYIFELRNNLKTN